MVNIPLFHGYILYMVPWKSMKPSKVVCVFFQAFLRNGQAAGGTKRWHCENSWQCQKKCASYQVWLSSHKDRKAGKSKKLKMTAVKHLFSPLTNPVFSNIRHEISCFWLFSLWFPIVSHWKARNDQTIAAGCPFGWVLWWPPIFGSGPPPRPRETQRPEIVGSDIGRIVSE